MLAALSRWRSWVQIPSGTFHIFPLLLGEGKGEGARYANSAKRPSSNLGDRLWVQLPPVLLENASAGHWRAQVAVTHPRSAVQVQLLPGALDGPFVYRRRTPAPQAGKVGSIPIRATWPSGGMVDTRRSERRAFKGMGVRLSPWSLRSGLESGFQHGLISRSTPVRIRPPQVRKSEVGGRRSDVESSTDF